RAIANLHQVDAHYGQRVQEKVDAHLGEKSKKETKKKKEAAPLNPPRKPHSVAAP
ncbi:Catalase, partial [Globisporangium polare]